MDPEQSERLRAAEVFHGLRAPAGSWIVIRVDGRSFTTYATKHYQRPFDRLFHDHMRQVAEALMREFGGLLAYTESDECSVVLGPGNRLFDRSVEKLVSLSAATATAAHVLSSRHFVSFDARLCLYQTQAEVLEYLNWRLDDCWRCCLNTWVYWWVRNQGGNVSAATKAARIPSAEKYDFLVERGVHPAELPGWQRRGALVVNEPYAHQGFNPQTQQTVASTRRRLTWHDTLPYGEDFRTYCDSLLSLVNPVVTR